MVLRFLKSVGLGAVVLLLALPYFALCFAVYWGASLIPWPVEMVENGIAGGATVALCLAPVILAAFRVDRGAAHVAALVEEEKMSYLFLPTRYWLTGFVLAAAPILIVVIVRVMTLYDAGIPFLAMPLGNHDKTVIAFNHIDIITTTAVAVYFLIYGVVSARRSLFERDPPSLCSAWASVILFTVPFFTISKFVTLALLDVLSTLPLEGFSVQRDLTLGHALAMQLAILWCLYATNAALVLRARLIKILEEIETQRMLPE